MARIKVEMTERQSRLLRRMASRSGTSENELTRRAVDALIRREATPSIDQDERKAAARDLAQSMREMAKGRSLTDDFKREYKEKGRSALYDD